MYGVLVHEQASKMLIVTSGEFTQEAKTFAQGKPVELINGSALLSLISNVQTSGNVLKSAYQQASVQTADIPSRCPHCKTGTLVQRRVKKGSRKGQTFTGCSNFPRCRFTQG